MNSNNKSTSDWLLVADEEHAMKAKKKGYPVKKMGNDWYYDKNKISDNSSEKIIENLIRKLLMEEKKFYVRKKGGTDWLEIEEAEYERKKKDPNYETKVEDDVNTKTDDKGTGGGGTATVTALPSWVSTHKCLQGVQPIGQGDNIIIAYKDGKTGTERKLLLSSNGTAVDTQDQGFTGTWKCTSDTNLVIETSKTSSSNSSDGSGSRSDGSLGSGGRSGCSKEMFPSCVTALQLQENPCSYKGFALTNDKVEYQVFYYPQKAKGPEGMEQFTCYVYNNGWKTGYYYCGVSGPIITTDLGQLTGINKGAYKVISSDDMAKIIADLNTIPGLIKTNREGTQIIGLSSTILTQSIYEIQNLVKNGWRGKSIGELMEYLQNLETLVETELNQYKPQVTAAIKDLNNIIKNNENAKFDQYYVVDTDPPSGLIKPDLYPPKYKVTDYEINTFNKTFKVYRSMAWSDKTKSGEMVGAYGEKVKKEGLNERECEEALKAYMIYIKKGNMVGATTTGAASDEYDPDLAKETIKACASMRLYDRGLFRGNKKYQQAIQWLRTQPENRGGIDFDKI